MFKKGDIVKCIDSDGVLYGHLTLGKTYLVQEVREGVWNYVLVENDMGENVTYSIGRFQLSSEPFFCWHNWEKYVGFTHTYYHCMKCGKKREDWNERTKV